MIAPSGVPAIPGYLRDLPDSAHDLLSPVQNNRRSSPHEARLLGIFLRFCVTENLIRSASTAVSGAPYFPNLYDEGRLGYQVRIDFPGCPLFLQYKLPERMIRDTADEISNRSLAGIVTPFFRMYLMKRSVSRQHELLVDLEHDHPDSGYYATPEMSSNSCLTLHIVPQKCICGRCCFHREKLATYPWKTAYRSVS